MTNSYLRNLLIGCLLLLPCVVAAQSALKFRKDGTFKIAQFTDTHFQVNNPASDIAIERINEVLDAEKPDLVIFTGDIVYNRPAETGMRTVLEPVSRRGIPFVIVFGNHDDEQDLTRTQLYDVARSVPGNLLPERGDRLSPDYVLKIASSGKPAHDAALLYCMDSNAYSPIKNQVKGYGWFRGEQVDWYRRQAAESKMENHGDTLPALAFFHIPLPEFAEAAQSSTAILRGTRMEKVCSPALNSGMFTAMKESGDVMGIFVGHDHDNDYAVLWYDILLAYGRFSGGNTEYNHLNNGARIIELHEGTRTFTTWVRQKEGVVLDKYRYPADFRRKESPNR
ncbi:MAG: metallophosphoesterase family protein [Prevotellaceae bacterium]|nr:metallophosphoesterase family protein [Prevotellaceae bacterium]